MSGSAFAVTHHAFSSGAGRTSDGNGSHWSTSKSPSYTKSVSWQHYRQDLEALISSGNFTWERGHELLARQGLLLMREKQGLVVMDAYNHDQTPVKASHVHPDLTLVRAEPHAGAFVRVPSDIFERVAPVSRYNPELAVSDRDIPGMKRDPELRRQRREARAAARDDLKARYSAWRANWQRPDLHNRERWQAIHDECRMRKARIRAQQRDPLVRKLHYHIAELQRMQALIALKESVKAERLELIGQGKWYPPSYRQWVEVEALKGDRAAISQLRGWDYRDRRHDNTQSTSNQRCVVLCEPGSAPLYYNMPGLKPALQKNGSIRFSDTDTGQHVCTDYGDRVVFRNGSDFASLQRELNRVSPVLFARDPKMGFAPEGNDIQFNQALAEMVGWYNVYRAGEEDQVRISRPDVDRMREQCEAFFRNAEAEQNTPAYISHEPRNDWKPPSPR